MKTVFITGASRGIGRQTAILFAQRKWNVAFTYLKNKGKALELEEIIKSFGVGALGICADASISDECNKAVDIVVKTFGRIDALVNNAGISDHGLIIDMADEVWHNMFSVNTNSVFYMCRAVLPYMLNKDTAIVNVSSMWGRTGASTEAHYSASKAAVIGFTKALAKEMGPSKIRVNAVCPGVIITDMNNNLSAEDMNELKEETPLERLGSPDDVAKAIYFLASEDASFITGQILGVDGGFVI